MGYADILVPAIALEEDEAALTAAAELAQKFGATPTALILRLHLASSFMDQEQPLSSVLSDIGAGSSSHAAQLRRGLQAWLDKAPVRFNVEDLVIEHAIHDDKIVAHARVHDLTILAQSAAHDRARQGLIEDILFKSGRAILLLPGAPRRTRAWDRVVIGWNGRAEAVRAVVGAMPLLRKAERVAVATVDAAHGAEGGDLVAHLRRHGVAAELRNLDSMGRTPARALLDEAIAQDADILVLGAYGHSRLQEFVLGGVTRELLAGAPLPLLLAH